jgi:hypothetical protein
MANITNLGYLPVVHLAYLRISQSRDDCIALLFISTRHTMGGICAKRENKSGAFCAIYLFALDLFESGRLVCVIAVESVG